MSTAGTAHATVGRRALSLWWDQVADDDATALDPATPLDGDTTADVTVIGAGLTGLWTAYYLTQTDPTLDVLVVEQEVAGFGASGRNGGWCSALFPTSGDGLARRHGVDAARAMRSAMRDTVTEVARAAAAEQIDCDLVQGGTLTVARTTVQLERVRAEVAADARWDDGTQLLDRAQVRERAQVDGALGGCWTQSCARLQPMRLVRGLVRVLRARGVRIAEKTRVLRHESGVVVTDHGTVRTGWTIRATEAWTPQLPGSRRAIAPVYSLMVATEPLDDATWARIGLSGAETFTEARNLVVYGQRTADGRIAFGGRGAPYHLASRVEPDFDRDEQVFEALRRELVSLFPVLSGVAFTHAWGGPLGIPRDWHASVGLDRATRTGWAGGYVGDGVSTTNLAGRTLADLVTGTDSALTRLPWVGHRSPSWEPEPLRWAGITAGLVGAEWVDAAERRTGRTSRLAPVLAALTGH